MLTSYAESSSLRKREGRVVEVFAQKPLCEGREIFACLWKSECMGCLRPLKLEAGGESGDPDLAHGSIWREDKLAGAIFKEDIENTIFLFSLEDGFVRLFLSTDESLLKGFEGLVGLVAEGRFIEHGLSLPRREAPRPCPAESLQITVLF